MQVEAKLLNDHQLKLVGLGQIIIPQNVRAALHVGAGASPVSIY